ncbi:MAG: hypothetical protein LBE12_02790 [Planctomycetaceae bacterium]|jgi:hypothetical protein|nr:hypothetical protein [Planctomycetaceae bacterium]
MKILLKYYEFLRDSSNKIILYFCLNCDFSLIMIIIAIKNTSKKRGLLVNVLYLLLLICLYARLDFVIADDSLVQTIIRDIENFAALNNIVPDDRDIEPLIRPHEHELTDIQIMQIASVLIKMQKPLISKNALAKLIDSKIASIQSIRIKYEVEVRSLDMSSSESDHRMVDFIMDKGQFYVNYSFNNKRKSTDKTLTQTIKAYNGGYVSSVKFFYDKSRIIEGEILPFEGLEELFPYECPLYYSCLFSQEILTQANKTPLSLSAALSGTEDQSGIIYEKTVPIDGVNCIQIYFDATRFYLDPNKDFSIVRIEKYRFVQDPSDGTEKQTTFRVFSMSDHIDCGNGVWIPKYLHLIYNLGSRHDRQVTIRVFDVEINKKIDPKIFTDIFPEETFVSDLVHKLTYKWSDRPSIESTLDSIIQRKSVTILRWISVISGLALIFIALVMKYRQYLRNKRERENRAEEETK